MKISYNWLKDYLECDLAPEAVAEALTSIGLEVDSLEQIEEIPGGLAGVIVAEVVECVDHPDSDHLHITKLNTGDNKLVSIPNSAVVASQIVNYTTNGTRRVDISISASYDMPIDQVLEALKEAAQVPTRLEDKEPFVAVKHYGDSAIEYVLQVWSTAGDYWTTMFAVNKRIKEVFDERGIRMTYPHLNVHLDQ